MGLRPASRHSPRTTRASPHRGCAPGKCGRPVGPLMRRVPWTYPLCFGVLNMSWQKSAPYSNQGRQTHVAPTLHILGVAGGSERRGLSRRCDRPFVCQPPGDLPAQGLPLQGAPSCATGRLPSRGVAIRIAACDPPSARRRRKVRSHAPRAVCRRHPPGGGPSRTDFSSRGARRRRSLL